MAIDYQKFISYIGYIAKAHQENTNQHGKTHRHLLTGEKNPYFTHPLWCASMVLCEPHLPESLRERYAHDIVASLYDMAIRQDRYPEWIVILSYALIHRYRKAQNFT